MLLPDSEKAKKPPAESFRLSASQACLNVADKNELRKLRGDLEEQLRTLLALVWFDWSSGTVGWSGGGRHAHCRNF